MSEAIVWSTLKEYVMRLSFIGLVVLMCVVGARSGDAAINFDPALPAPAPILDAGWTSDSISYAYTDSSDSPYSLNLSVPAYFRITDDFVTGDKFYVYDGASLILTTSTTTPAVRTAFGDNLSADAAWVSSTYEHGEILLGPGTYSLRVQGNGAGGVPAGFWTRLDSVPPTGEVPEPFSLAVWCGLGAVGIAIGAARRRRQKQTI